MACVMYSHDGDTSICHTSTGKMHSILYFWSKLNAYPKQVCSILSPLCIFQGRLLMIPTQGLTSLNLSIATLPQLYVISFPFSMAIATLEAGSRALLESAELVNLSHV